MHKLWTVVRPVFLVLVTVLWLLPVWLMVVNAITPSVQYSGTPAWWPGDEGALLRGRSLQAVGVEAPAMSPDEIVVLHLTTD